MRARCRRCPRGGEDKAFGEAGDDQLRAAGTQRGADGGLALGSDGTGKLQVGKVDAGDEQHGSHRSEKEPTALC